MTARLPRVDLTEVLLEVQAWTGFATDFRFWDPDDFFSPHPSGLDFLMGDGSVKFIKSTVSPSVYGGLFSRNLGEVVSADAF